MEITFQEIRASTTGADEPGLLVWVRDSLAALLVEAEEGWFLHSGFGRFEGEGLIFATLASAEEWITERCPSVI